MKGNLKVTAASQEGSGYCSQQIRSWTDSPVIALFLHTAEPDVLKDDLDLFVLFEYLKLFKFSNYLIVLRIGRSLENRDRDLQMKSFIYLFILLET